MLARPAFEEKSLSLSTFNFLLLYHSFWYLALYCYSLCFVAASPTLLCCSLSYYLLFAICFLLQPLSLSLSTFYLQPLLLPHHIHHPLQFLGGHLLCPGEHLVKVSKKITLKSKEKFKPGVVLQCVHLPDGGPQPLLHHPPHRRCCSPSWCSHSGPTSHLSSSIGRLCRIQ